MSLLSLLWWVNSLVSLSKVCEAAAAFGADVCVMMAEARRCLWRPGKAGAFATSLP